MEKENKSKYSRIFRWYEYVKPKTSKKEYLSGVNRMVKLITKDLEEQEGFNSKKQAFKLFLFFTVNFPDVVGVSEGDLQMMKEANTNVALINSPAEGLSDTGEDYRDLELIDKGLGMRWIINTITDWCVNGIDDNDKAEMVLVGIVRDMWDTFNEASKWYEKEEEIHKLNNLWENRNENEE